ncbi:MAG: hypothetical protein ACRCT2_13880 [Plesiomonas shigelloides]
MGPFGRFKAEIEALGDGASPKAKSFITEYEELALEGQALLDKAQKIERDSRSDAGEDDCDKAQKNVAR